MGDHRVRYPATPTWSQPDPAAPSNPPLDAGTLVDVLERRGEWAEVRTSAGWLTWVAAEALEVVADGPAPPPPPPPPVQSQPSSPVRLHLPAGWTASADGLTAAAWAPDLTSAVPQAARVRAILDAATMDLPSGNLRSGPEATTVDGRPAVAVTFSDGPPGAELLQRYVAVTGSTLLFVLEAPSTRFDAELPVMATVPGLAPEAASTHAFDATVTARAMPPSSNGGSPW